MWSGDDRLAGGGCAGRQHGKVVVVEGPDRPLQALLDGEVTVAVQQEPRGTADAVKAAAAHIGPSDTVIVLNGDHPLITADTLAGLAQAHARSGAAATLATAVLDDPSGYGRVVRAPDGTVERVVETKAPGDATELELRIREISTGIYAFEGAALLAALDEVRSDNAQGELYLPDVVPIMRSRERSVLAHEIHDASELGVNDRVGLAAVRAVAQRRIHERHMIAGVTIVDPVTTLIDVDVRIGPDTTIAPFSSLHGSAEIGAGATVGPLSTVIDTRIGAQATVVHSYLNGADVGDRVSVGPFAYLRPGAVLREGSKAGTFVEIKNSDIGAGARRSRICPTSGMPTSASGQTSAPGRSPPTTTARTSTARRSATVRSSASTRCSWRRSASATAPTRAPAR